MGFFNLLNDALTFLRHLLLHEIAHIKRRDMHSTLSDDEIERDCDEWAFQNLNNSN